MEEILTILNENIKQEPEVEFTLVLRPFQPEKKLDLKLENFVDESESDLEYDLRLKSIFRSKRKLESYICDICGEALKLKVELLEHLIHSHTKPKTKPFTCECGKSLSSKQNLKNHEKTHEKKRKPRKRKPIEVEKVVRECKICHKHFSEKYFKIHKNNHRKEECTVCPKRSQVVA